MLNKLNKPRWTRGIITNVHLPLFLSAFLSLAFFNVLFVFAPLFRDRAVRSRTRRWGRTVAAALSAIRGKNRLWGQNTLTRHWTLTHTYLPETSWYLASATTYLQPHWYKFKLKTIAGGFSKRQVKCLTQCGFIREQFLPDRAKCHEAAAPFATTYLLSVKRLPPPGRGRWSQVHPTGEYPAAVSKHLCWAAVRFRTANASCKLY